MSEISFLALLLVNKDVSFLGNVHSIEKEISVNHPILQQLWRRKLAAEEQVRLCICLLKAALTGIQKRTCAPAHRHTLLTCDLLTPDSLLLKSVKSHRSKTKVCRRSRWITRRLRVKKKKDFSKMFGGAWQQSQLNKSPNSPLQQNSYHAYLCTSTVLKGCNIFSKKGFFFKYCPPH